LLVFPPRSPPQPSALSLHDALPILAGRYSDGSLKKIQLPMAPEYIGYADAGLSHDFFRAARPSFEFLDDHLFKYRVNFRELEIRSEEHTSELQSREKLVCRLLLEKK